MLKFYHILKWNILILFLLAVISVLVYENIKEMNLDLENRAVIKDAIVVYQDIKNFVLADPYNSSILIKVDRVKEEFEDLFEDVQTGFGKLTTDKNFYNTLFIFMVSKRSEEMEQLVKKYLVPLPGFLDFIVIDKDNNVLYKYGGSSFSAEFHGNTNDTMIYWYGENPGIVRKYSDSTLDYEIEIIVLLKKDAAVVKLNSVDFPAFLVINHQEFKNNQPLPNIYSKIIRDIENERKYYIGMKVVETANIFLNHFYLGSLGLTYPSRSLGSTLLILLKLIGLFFVLAILLSFDNLVEKKLRKSLEWRTISKKREINREAEEKDQDVHLDWVKDYIENAEGKKQ